MIKWRFIFGDKHLDVDVDNEVQDGNIINAVEMCKEILFIPGEERDIYVNLENTLVTIREPICEAKEAQSESNT